jgi:K+-transporting ATPase c subunit
MQATLLAAAGGLVRDELRPTYSAADVDEAGDLITASGSGLDPEISPAAAPAPGIGYRIGVEDVPHIDY